MLGFSPGSLGFYMIYNLTNIQRSWWEPPVCLAPEAWHPSESCCKGQVRPVRKPPRSWRAGQEMPGCPSRKRDTFEGGKGGKGPQGRKNSFIKKRNTKYHSAPSVCNIKKEEWLNGWHHLLKQKTFPIETVSAWFRPGRDAGSDDSGEHGARDGVDVAVGGQNAVVWHTLGEIQPQRWMTEHNSHFQMLNLKIASAGCCIFCQGRRQSRGWKLTIIQLWVVAI